MKFKYFSFDEFACRATSENKIDEEFVHKLDELREACGFPFVITSGYRSRKHPIERRKDKPGMHTKGIAADIAVSGGAQRALLVEKAIELGFNGIGVAKGFVHVDTRGGTRVLWCYE